MISVQQNFTVPLIKCFADGLKVVEYCFLCMCDLIVDY